jgi:glutathione S-transferase
MIVYGSSLSPFVRKVLIVAAEKGIAIENVPIGLGSTDPAFRVASPFGKVPALVDGDYALADSSAIVAYFEAVWPEPALIPAEAKARGKVIWFDEFADTIFVAAAGALFFNRIVSPRFLGRPGDLAAADKAEAEALPPVLDYIERMLAPNGHLVGGALSLADVAVASPFANLEHAGYRLDAARYPNCATFVAQMFARPAFATLLAGERRFLATPAPKP